MSHLTYAEAMIIGLIQGVTELFPVSSLGHSVLIPALVGGSWAQDLSVSRPESPYLAFIVGLHVATATAMIIYFRHDWARIVTGFFSSVRDQTIATAGQKLAWMIVLPTIPVGLSGLALEHTFRVVFSKPVPTALFLTLDGVILLAGERARRRSGGRGAAQQPAMAATGHPAQSPGRYPASRCPACGNSWSSSQWMAQRRPRTGGWPGWATARPSWSAPSRSPLLPGPGRQPAVRPRCLLLGPVPGPLLQ